MYKTEFDAIVVGSGPNGLAAAITLQQQGLSVLLLEGKSTIGGGLRTAELTLPGFHHDVCSAVHPLAVASPFFKTLPLAEYGLEFMYPDIAAAHPFDDGKVAILTQSLETTSRYLGVDKEAYIGLIKPLTQQWEKIDASVLGPPLNMPKYPLEMAKFGLKALRSAEGIAQRFHAKEARGLWAGMAAHAIQPLDKYTTAGVGLVLATMGHLKGWPIAKGGSMKIANALASYFLSLGGRIETNFYVKSLSQLPSAKALIFDVTPKQILKIAGHKFSSLYRWQVGRFRYGMGVFKVDWALAERIPFIAQECRNAGTVHLGNTFEEIALSEKLAWSGKIPKSPFVLLSQPGVLDESRAPEGKHTAWAYCHVPKGSLVDMTTAIENQVERFAPGFKDRILARHTFNSAQLEEYNPNYIGGDINGGILNIRQFFTRPVLSRSPYKTSASGIYICSSSTPPGGGVHGMCGYHAATAVLRDIFKISP